MADDPAQTPMHEKRRDNFRAAIIFAWVIAAAACATPSFDDEEEWAAHGYLTPGPTSEPDLIGIYDSLDDCKKAADAWAGRQVVGNPVYADCYPVDKH